MPLQDGAALKQIVEDVGAEHTTVFSVVLTSDCFVSYPAYIERIRYLQSPSFQCVATQTRNLSYSDALTSELRAIHTIRRFPSFLVPHILRLVSSKAFTEQGLSILLQKDDQHDDNDRKEDIKTFLGLRDLYHKHSMGVPFLGEPILLSDRRLALTVYGSSLFPLSSPRNNRLDSNVDRQFEGAGAGTDDDATENGEGEDEPEHILAHRKLCVAVTVSETAYLNHINYTTNLLDHPEYYPHSLNTSLLTGAKPVCSYYHSQSGLEVFLLREDEYVRYSVLPYDEATSYLDRADIYPLTPSKFSYMCILLRYFLKNKAVLVNDSNHELFTMIDTIIAKAKAIYSTFNGIFDELLTIREIKEKFVSGDIDFSQCAELAILFTAFNVSFSAQLGQFQQNWLFDSWNRSVHTFYPLRPDNALLHAIAIANSFKPQLMGVSIKIAGPLRGYNIYGQVIRVDGAPSNDNSIERNVLMQISPPLESHDDSGRYYLNGNGSNDSDSSDEESGAINSIGSNNADTTRSSRCDSRASTSKHKTANKSAGNILTGVYNDNGLDIDSNPANGSNTKQNALSDKIKGKAKRAPNGCRTINGEIVRVKDQTTMEIQPESMQLQCRIMLKDDLDLVDCPPNEDRRLDILLREPMDTIISVVAESDFEDNAELAQLFKAVDQGAGTCDVLYPRADYTDSLYMIKDPEPDLSEKYPHIAPPDTPFYAPFSDDSINQNSAVMSLVMTIWTFLHRNMSYLKLPFITLDELCAALNVTDQEGYLRQLQFMQLAPSELERAKNESIADYYLEKYGLADKKTQLSHVFPLFNNDMVSPLIYIIISRLISLLYDGEDEAVQEVTYEFIRKPQTRPKRINTTAHTNRSPSASSAGGTSATDVSSAMENASSDDLSDGSSLIKENTEAVAKAKQGDKNKHEHNNSAFEPSSYSYYSSYANEYSYYTESDASSEGGEKVHAPRHNQKGTVGNRQDARKKSAPAAKQQQAKGKNEGGKQATKKQSTKSGRQLTKKPDQDSKSATEDSLSSSETYESYDTEETGYTEESDESSSSTTDSSTSTETQQAISRANAIRRGSSVLQQVRVSKRKAGTAGNKPLGKKQANASTAGRQNDIEQSTTGYYGSTEYSETDDWDVMDGTRDNQWYDQALRYLLSRITENDKYIVILRILPIFFKLRVKYHKNLEKLAPVLLRSISSALTSDQLLATVLNECHNPITSYTAEERAEAEEFIRQMAVPKAQRVHNRSATIMRQQGKKTIRVSKDPSFRSNGAQTAFRDGLADFFITMQELSAYGGGAPVSRDAALDITSDTGVAGADIDAGASGVASTNVDQLTGENAADQDQDSKSSTSTTVDQDAPLNEPRPKRIRSRDKYLEFMPRIPPFLLSIPPTMHMNVCITATYVLSNVAFILFLKRLHQYLHYARCGHKSSVSAPACIHFHQLTSQEKLELLNYFIHQIAETENYHTSQMQEQQYVENLQLLTKELETSTFLYFAKARREARKAELARYLQKYEEEIREFKDSCLEKAKTVEAKWNDFVKIVGVTDAQLSSSDLAFEELTIETLDNYFASRVAQTQTQTQVHQVQTSVQEPALKRASTACRKPAGFQTTEDIDALKSILDSGGGPSTLGMQNVRSHNMHLVRTIIARIRIENKCIAYMCNTAQNRMFNSLYHERVDYQRFRALYIMLCAEQDCKKYALNADSVYTDWYMNRFILCPMEHGFLTAADPSYMVTFSDMFMRANNLRYRFRRLSHRQMLRYVELLGNTPRERNLSEWVKSINKKIKHYRMSANVQKLMREMPTTTYGFGNIQNMLVQSDEQVVAHWIKNFTASKRHNTVEDTKPQTERYTTERILQRMEELGIPSFATKRPHTHNVASALQLSSFGMRTFLKHDMTEG